MAFTYFFNTENDAQLVAQQLYDCEVKKNSITFTTKVDRRAVELAISLSGANLVIEQGSFSLLPFPKHERQAADGVPQIYVACLSAYNNGYLHGLWIDASQDVDGIQDDINWMLSWSPVAHLEACEDWAIHANEGFCRISISEWEDLEKVSLYGQLINEADDEDAVTCFIDWAKGCDIDLSVDEFQSRYLGQWDSSEDFALKSDEIQEAFNFNAMEKQFPFWAGCIDWSQVARELELGDTYEFIKASPYGVHVFKTDC